MHRTFCRVATAALIIGAAQPEGFAQPERTSESEQQLRQAHQLAKAGEYAHAIDAYKRANQLAPRAEHHCLIGLAYVRLAAWAQAEVALSACRDLATDADPAPPWLVKAMQELEGQMQASRIPAVTFRVQPDDLTTRLSMVGWPADESFRPRTLHFPAGHYSVEAMTSTASPVRMEFDVVGTKHTVEINLSPPPKLAVKPPAARREPSLQREPAARPSRKVAYAFLGGGALVAAAGAAFHVLAVQQRTAMQTSAESWDTHRAAFDRYRFAAIGGYAIGTVLVGTGTFLLLRHSTTERSVSVAPWTSGDQVGLALEWSR